jgi:hypothetical protein
VNATTVLSPNGENNCIPAGLQGKLQYQIARNLYFGTVVGFESASVTAPERALAQCYTGRLALSGGSTVNQLIDAAGFVNLAPTGKCTGTCSANADCGTGGVCSGGTCSAGSCTETSQCGAGLTCSISGYPCCRDFAQSGCSSNNGAFDACGNNGSVNLPTGTCAF